MFLFFFVFGFLPIPSRGPPTASICAGVALFPHSRPFHVIFNKALKSFSLTSFSCRLGGLILLYICSFLCGPVPSSFRAFSPNFATSIVSCTLCCFESLEKNTFQLHIYTSLCLLFLDYRYWSCLHSI